MKKYKLRKFYLWTWLILAIIMCIAYISSGAVEGYIIPLLLEIIFGGILAIIPTLIYFFFTHHN